MTVPWPNEIDAATHNWLVNYCVWRINSGKATTRPKGIPDPVPNWADPVLYWVIWRRKGRPAPRPDFPTKIPGWAYQVLDDVNPRAPIQIPDTPLSWVLIWAIERFKGTPPSEMPPNVPKDVSVVAPYVWSFLNWAAWQRRRFSNPTAPRPNTIPEAIPKWCWSHLKQINIAVPLGPPPPPPPPPGPPRPADTWGLPFPAMFTSWGWFSDSQYRDNDEALNRMRDAGVRSVGLQVAGGQPLFAPNVPDRCRAFGMDVFIWGVADPRDEEVLALSRAKGYCPQVENPDEYQRAMTNLRAGIGQGIGRSVVSTLYGFNTYTRRPPNDVFPDGQLTTEEYEAMRPFCTHVLVESYIQDGGAHFPIINMIFSAMQRGFDYINPVIGLYRDATIAQYRPVQDPNTLNSYGRQIGVYLSEGMNPGNWTELRALGL